MLAKHQPLKIHEDILVFSSLKHNYQPQGLVRVDKLTRQGKRITDNIGGGERATVYRQEFTNYPKSIQVFKNETGHHPTQKPVALFEYLIKTYTNEGDLVLDNVAGSFTTAVAADNLNRNWICIEQEQEYCEIGRKRINENRERLHLLDNRAIIRI